MTLGRCINHTPNQANRGLPKAQTLPIYSKSGFFAKGHDDGTPPSATQRGTQLQALQPLPRIPGFQLGYFSSSHRHNDAPAALCGRYLPQIHHPCCKEGYGRSPDSTFVMPKSKFTVHAVKFVIGRDVRSFHCKREWPFIMLRMTVTFCFRSFLTTTQNPTLESASLP
jgi:hypothetical protein